MSFLICQLLYNTDVALHVYFSTMTKSILYFSSASFLSGNCVNLTTGVCCESSNAELLSYKTR